MLTCKKGDNERAKEQLKYLETINEVSPLNFKVAYSFAAIPARIVLENKNWQAAASLQVRTTSFPWK
ncbi:MAG: hypothetical protein JNN00_10650, partial [Chitinophagaceae bacterium]|nr:hypothetical protein [Chitinophagaceae bacterium]